MATITRRIELEEISCGQCGIEFAIDSRVVDDRRRTHDTFYCPNGHARHFPGESKEERLARELREERDRVAAIRAERDQLTATLRTTRGVVTKLRKRGHAGVCPFGCRRHFVDLERHVASRHPGAHLEGESDA